MIDSMTDQQGVVDRYNKYITLQTKMMEALFKASSEKELYHIATLFTQQLMEVQGCLLLLLNTEKRHIRAVSARGSIKPTGWNRHCPVENTLIAMAIEKQSIQIHNKIVSSTLYDVNCLIEVGAKSVMVAPLSVHGEIIGTLILARNTDKPFTTIEESLAVQFTTLFSSSLERKLLLKSAHDNLDQTLKTARLNAELNEMLIEIGAASSITEIYSIVTRKTRKMFGMMRSTLARIEPDKNLVTVFSHEGQDDFFIEGAHFSLDASSFNTFLDSSNILINGDLEHSEYPDHRMLFQETEARSSMQAPLFVDNILFGSLNVVARGANAFGEEDTYILFQITSHVSALIDNFQKKAELEQRTRLVEATNSELNVTIHNLNEKATELRHTLESNKELLGITSHDLKNPLGGIIGLCELILEDVASLQGSMKDDVLENTNLIQGEAERMLSIIKEVLDKHRHDADLQLTYASVDLTGIIEDVIAWNHSQADSKHIHINFDMSGPFTVHVDISSLQRAIDNFLSNAVKYSPFNSRVWIELDRHAVDGSFWKLSIRDEGPGLTPDDLKRVFGKMQRLSATPTGGEHSTGLGLYIVKQIIEQHGGSVGVESIFGEGSTFWMMIPNHSTSLQPDTEERSVSAG